VNASTQKAPLTQTSLPCWVQEKELQSTNVRPLPCIVVCPSTLVQHWAYEVHKYVPPANIRPFAYGGNPAERAAQQVSQGSLSMTYTNDWLIGWLGCLGMVSCTSGWAAFHVHLT
jgi:SNF2 family DNA or RNA helicase